MPSFGISFGSGNGDDDGYGRKNGESFGNSSHNVKMSPKVASIFTVAVGVVFLIVAGFLYNTAQKPDPRSVSVVGTVISVDERRDMSANADVGDVKCEAVVEYVAEDGVTYTSAEGNRYSGSRCPWREGGSASVRYNPANPSDSTLNAPVKTYYAFIFGGVGLLIVGAGAVSYIRKR